MTKAIRVDDMELSNLHSLLYCHFGDYSKAESWYVSHNRILGEVPEDMVQDGRLEEVAMLVDCLRERDATAIAKLKQSLSWG